MTPLILLTTPLFVLPIEPPKTVTTYSPNGIVVTNAGDKMITTFSSEGIKYSIVNDKMIVTFDKKGQVQPVIVVPQK